MGFSAAADVKPEAKTEIQELVVTSAPVARGNSVVSKKAIEVQSNATNIVNAIANVPGVSIRGSDALNADPWTYGINIRGFDVNLRSSKLGQTIDDMPAYNASYYLGGAPAQKYLMNEIVDRIQVNQGSAGVGSASSSALGGTIAYTTRAPREVMGGELSFTGGDNNTKRYAGVFDTGRVLNDTTRAYFGASRLTACRWVYGCSDNSGVDETHAEAKFITELGKLKVMGRISYDEAVDDPIIEASRGLLDTTNKGDGSSPIWTGTTPAGVNENYAHVWSAHRDNTMGYLKLNYQVTDKLSVEVSPYFHHQRGQGDWAPPYQQIALDPTNTRTLAGGTATGASRKKAYYGWVDPSGRQRAVVKGLDYTDMDGTLVKSSFCYNADGSVNAACVPSQTYRTSKYGHNRFGFTSVAKFEIANHQLEGGVWYERLERDFGREWHQIIDIRQGQSYYKVPQLIDFMQHFETDQVKVYATDTMTFGDLTVNVGLQSYFIDIKGTTDGWDAYGKPAGGFKTKLNADSDLLASIGATYKLSSDWQIFGNFSQNYGAVGDWALEKTNTDTNKLKSSVSNVYEAGVRYATRSLKASLTGYYIDYNHAITFLTADRLPGSNPVDPSNSGGINYTAGTGGAYINTGKGIRSSGVELAGSYVVNPYINLVGSFSYNQSEYMSDFDGTTANAGSVTRIKKGNDVPGTPPVMASIGADFRKDNFRASISAKYSDKSAGDAANTSALYMPAFTTMDASVGYRMAIEDGRYADFQLNVTNLTGEKYIGGMLDEFTQKYTRGAPRTVLGTVKVGF